jgi:integrase
MGGYLYRPTYTRALPENPRFETRGGKRSVRLSLRSKKCGARRVVWAQVTAAGDRCVVESAAWWARYDDENGQEQLRQLSHDKAVAGEMLGRILGDVRLRRMGLAEPWETQLPRPLGEHVAEYRADLEGNKRSKKHVDKTISYIRTTLAACRFNTLAEVDGPKIAAFLAKRRATKKKGRRGTLSISGSNGYVTALRSFGNWLVENGRDSRNRFLSVEKLNAEIDPRHQRRAFSRDELALLLAAAESGPEFRGLSGADRSMLYRVAMYTGLRVSELASLSPASFAFSAEPPVVRVEASKSKRRRNDRVPLHPALVALVRPWLKRDAGTAEGSPAQKVLPFATRPLWPGTWPEKASVMVRRDLKQAREAWVEAAAPDERSVRQESDFLAYRNRDGLVGDFHALRHTFITRLTEAGIHPAQAKELARHSTVALTIDRYSHVQASGLYDSLCGLDAINPAKPDAAAATGTDAGATRAPACGKNQNSAVPSPSFTVRHGPSVAGPGDDGERGNMLRARNFDERCVTVTNDDKEPPGGLEPSTYALRMRRSTN